MQMYDLLIQTHILVTLWPRVDLDGYYKGRTGPYSADEMEDDDYTPDDDMDSDDAPEAGDDAAPYQKHQKYALHAQFTTTPQSPVCMVDEDASLVGEGDRKSRRRNRCRRGDILSWGRSAAPASMRKLPQLVLLLLRSIRISWMKMIKNRSRGFMIGRRTPHHRSRRMRIGRRAVRSVRCITCVNHRRAASYISNRLAARCW